MQKPDATQNISVARLERINRGRPYQLVLVVARPVQATATYHDRDNNSVEPCWEGMSLTNDWNSVGLTCNTVGIPNHDGLK